MNAKHTLLSELLSESFARSSLVEVYDREGEYKRFAVGVVVAFSDVGFVLGEIDEDGKWDELSVRRIADIQRVARNTSYIQRIRLEDPPVLAQIPPPDLESSLDWFAAMGVAVKLTDRSLEETLCRIVRVSLDHVLIEEIDEDARPIGQEARRCDSILRIYYPLELAPLKQ